MASIFDRLRNHAKYVNETTNKINKYLDKLDNDDLILTDLNSLLDLTFEEDLNELLEITEGKNEAIETLKLESETCIYSMVKQLETLELQFNHFYKENQSNLTVESDEKPNEIDAMEIKGNIPEIEITEAADSSCEHIYKLLQEVKLKVQEEENC